MIWAVTPFLIPIMISALITLDRALNLWYNRESEPGSRAAAVTLLAGATWMVGAVFELWTGELGSKVFWEKVQFFGIVTLPTALFIFMQYYTGRESWVTPFRLVLLGIVPAATLLLALTSQSHNLIYTRLELVHQGPFPALKHPFGVWLWFYLGYSVVLASVAAVTLARMLRRQKRLTRRKRLLILFFMIISSIIFAKDLWPSRVPPLDIEPYVLALFCPFAAYSLFRLRYGDIIPVARGRIFDEMGDSVFILDANDRILDTNRAARDLIDQKAADVVGHSIREFWEKWPAPEEDGIDPTPVSREISWQPVGDMRVYDLKVSPIVDSRGRPKSKLAVLRDISDRKEMEAEMRKAKKLAEAANASKSEFLARMSHEIRTPMNGMLGMLDLLGQTELTDKQRRFVTTAKRSSDGLLRVINEVLDFSKIEAARMKLEKTDFALRETVEGTLAPLRQRAREKGLQLAVDIEEDVRDALRGDPGRLGQVLGNLVHNAIKFTERGEVTVRVSAVKEDADSARLHFRVADTGIGIAPEEQRQIFDVFSQADESITRKFGGTGLGLPICKQLAEMMGGQIGVESEPGKGSTFWFTARFSKGSSETLGESTQRFDLQERRVLTETPLAGSSQRIRDGMSGKREEVLHGARILLAEDNPVNREVALGMLENLGCRVEAACDGLEAVEVVTRSGFDLILMDCEMPEMDGYRATTLIRRREQATGRDKDSTPIIALTAHAMEGARERCLAAGMDDYLAKPFTQDQLAEVLGRWLEKKGASQESRVVEDDPAVRASSDVEANQVSIDRKALDTIRALQRQGKPDLLAREINIYLEDSLRLLEALRQAVSQGDAADVKRTAHSLKSSSAHVGAVRLSSLCQDLEQVDEGLPLEQIGPMVEQIEEEYRSVQAYLRRELQE
jgi:PAS domain S-box-containing protein